MVKLINLVKGLLYFYLIKNVDVIILKRVNFEKVFIIKIEKFAY